MSNIDLVIQNLDILYSKELLSEHWNKVIGAASTLLKAEKPYLLTLNEAYRAEIVWYESRTVYDSGYAILLPGDTKTSTTVKRINAGNAYEDDLEYGSIWRCWAGKPTIEQRKAAEWKEII